MVLRWFYTSSSHPEKCAPRKIQLIQVFAHPIRKFRAAVISNKKSIAQLIAQGLHVYRITIMVTAGLER